ncbi:hypothetical protein H9639_10350 [Arthrobacter sp. Sa2CUA1]|uniref:Type II secretion system protein GspF domain-containing protein n=1 Tax=Arthrobacter gallicola TaxID=2762225 RepID=A0ABR8UT44_9MICC|nr:hypothetical protein [Arthrobacter gallicola]MBD7995698.1 hypothetical protein [Arthrobacter gallicola]
MTGALVGVLLAAAWLVLLGGGRDQLRILHSDRYPGAGTDAPHPGPEGSAGSRAASARMMPSPAVWLKKANREEDLHRFPLLVHQLAGLLKAGRTPSELWTDAARLRREGIGSHGFGTVSGAREAVILESAARAAGLGFSPVPLLREAALSSRSIEAMVWNDLAACVSASERSGAPLAGILARYAQGLDAVLDARAARATALSGPKATVRVLTWLPAAGLGMGYALGADPLAMLAQTPLGWSTAGAGAGLAFAAWLWTRFLVRRAAGPEPG